MRLAVLLGSCLAFSMLVAGPAAAQEPGESGTLALAADRVFGFSYTTQTTERAGIETSTSITTIGLLGSYSLVSASALPRLSADYFAGPGVSLGGSLVYVHLSPSTEVDGQETEDGGSVGIFLISPRVGYAKMFNENVGIWPRAGITYMHASGEGESMDGTGATVTTDTSASQTLLNIEAMLVLSPAPSVGLTLGPTFDYELGRSQEIDGDDALDGVSTSYTSIGLQAGLLAWF